MLEKNDWRLMGQEDYLMNATLSKQTWHKPTERWDHDHCIFCTDKFSEYQGDIHEGYCTPDHMYWMCEECYQDFKEMLHFVLLEEKEVPKQED